MAIDATECPNCGCPVETQTTLAGQESSVEIQPKKKNVNITPYWCGKFELFTTKYGTPICDQIMIDAIKRIVDEINLCKDELEQFESFTPHCLRHSFATRCFESGISPKTGQTYLGHSSLQMTESLYISVLPNQKQDEMKKFENALDNISECGDSIAEERYKRVQR